VEISFKIEDGLLRIVQVGAFDAGAYLGLIEKIVAHPDYRSDLPTVADSTGVTAPPTASDMQRIRDAFNEGALRAFRPKRYAVVTAAPMYEMIVKLYGTLIVDGLESPAPGAEVRRFVSMEKAEAWACGKG